MLTRPTCVRTIRPFATLADPLPKTTMNRSSFRFFSASPLSSVLAPALTLAIGGFIAGSAFFAGSAQALRPVVLAAPPSAIGVVNMAVLFDRLNEAAEWDVKLKNLEAKFSNEVAARRVVLETMAKEIEQMPEGPDRETKLDAMRLSRLQAESWGGMKELELDRERSLKWQAIYRAVREGAARLADSEKFDMIVVDDSKIEIQTQRAKDAPPLEAQAKAQITQLRVLNAGKSIDVTEKLIVQINNNRSKT